MGVGIVAAAIAVVNGVKCQHDRGIELQSLGDRVGQAARELSIGLGVTAANPQPPAHEAKRRALRQPLRHRAVRHRERADVNVAVDDLGVGF